MNPEDYESYQMQDAIQQRALSQQQSLYAPQAFEQVQQNQAVLVEQVNPKKVVDDIMAVLRGKEIQKDGTEKKIGEPVMNEYGLSKTLIWLRSHVNQRSTLTHLESENIGKIMEGLSDDLVDQLTLNYRAYGIKKEDLDMVNDAILKPIFETLKSAEGQNEKNWIGKISIENINNQSKLPDLKKEGMLSKFKL